MQGSREARKREERSYGDKATGSLICMVLCKIREERRSRCMLTQSRKGYACQDLSSRVGKGKFADQPDL